MKINESKIRKKKWWKWKSFVWLRTHWLFCIRIVHPFGMKLKFSRCLRFKQSTTNFYRNSKTACKIHDDKPKRIVAFSISLKNNHFSLLSRHSKKMKRNNSNKNNRNLSKLTMHRTFFNRRIYFFLLLFRFWFTQQSDGDQKLCN